MSERPDSVSPGGERFPLPSVEDYPRELERLEALVAEQRRLGREVVVVVGVGFVGVVMAAVIADAVDADGEPSKFVVAMQRPSVRSYWKIPLLARGESPVKAEDPEVAELIERCVKEKGTLVGTYSHEVLELADVVVVDVQCDYRKAELGDVRRGEVEMEALRSSLATIAERVEPDALVLIETTVPPGTTENVAYPLMKQIFERRGILSDPLLAHSYERVMPGRDYVASVRDFWRVASGINAEARARVTRFLDEVLNTDEFPLTVLDRPLESETAKIIENSFRATLLAFMDEWSLFAERTGIDLKKVIDAIKVRPTHSNILFPGPGVGGYCLPKDGGLGVWAYRHLLDGTDDIFRLTPQAIDINDVRGLHVAELVSDALGALEREMAGARVLVLGAAYREDVGDTRYSGSEMVVRRLTELGARVSVHDPYVESWPEMEDQDRYPQSRASRARFFQRQESLADLRLEEDLWVSIPGVDAVVLAVRHRPYLDLDPARLVGAAGRPVAVIDCFCILSDADIRRYFELGCEVRGLGRGHVTRLRDEVRKAREAESEAQRVAAER